MVLSGIYKIKSIVSPDKCYIGSAVNIIHRWNCHLSDLRLNKHTNKKLQNHYNKYGKNDLIFSVIIVCNQEDLINTEQYYLDTETPYFNIRKIANNNLGCRWKMSEEGRKNIINSLIGRKHSEETKKKMRKPKSDEFKQSLRKKKTEDHKQHMRKPKSDLHKLHIKESWVIRNKHKNERNKNS